MLRSELLQSNWIMREQGARLSGVEHLQRQSLAEDEKQRMRRQEWTVRASGRREIYVILSNAVGSPPRQQALPAALRAKYEIGEIALH
mgnify:CR=1 FL=1